jgi:hypothetical protein
MTNVFGWYGSDSQLVTSITGLPGEVDPTTPGPFVVSASDLSGKGNTLFGDHPRGHHLPRWAPGLDIPADETLGIEAFQTDKMVFSTRHSSRYSGQAWKFAEGKSFTTDGEWCITFVTTNRRGRGLRQVFGNGADHGTLDQGSGRMGLEIGGVSARIAEGIHMGFVVVEVRRDAGGRIFVLSNESDVSSGAVMPGPVTFDGWGYNLDGGSTYWDDHLLALVFAGQTTEQERAACRSYLSR